MRRTTTHECKVNSVFSSNSIHKHFLSIYPVEITLTKKTLFHLLTEEILQRLIGKLSGDLKK